MHTADKQEKQQQDNLQTIEVQQAKNGAVAKRRRRKSRANRMYFDVPSELIEFYAQSEMGDDAKARIRAEWDKYAVAEEAADENDDDPRVMLVDADVSPVEHPSDQWAMWKK